MKESQHVEWKESWRDEYLKWICGFANTEGGMLVIGRNDKGRVVGIPDAARLLEELPNRCHYYQRSGSTLQDLKGAALDRFLLRRQGRTWDGMPVPGVTVRDLASAAVRRFRTLAKSSGRVEPGILREPVSDLIDKLRLREGAHLKRAALLLFHKDPERFVSGAFVKIGFFRTESDLAYHDEVHGDLFTQVAATIDMLRTKYLKAAIRYDGIHRIEYFPVPNAALREAVLNALVHRDYAVAAPIQIRVYEDRLRIWNPAVLPEGWGLDDLLREHASLPYNPNIANTFFRAGEIEAWGRGIQRIFQACIDAGTPEPQIRLSGHDLWVEFAFSSGYLKAVSPKGDGAPVTEPGGKTPVKTPVKTPDRILVALAARPDLTLAEVASSIGKSLSAVERAAAKLVKAHKLRFVGPQKGGHWEVFK